MIKYLGSKRVLVPAIVETVRRTGGAVGAAPGSGGTVLDLFSGTARVGHALKREGWRVIAVDHNAYAATLAACYVGADADDVVEKATRLIAELNDVARGAGEREAGWFTETYCRRARYFRPENGARIEAVRRAIAAMSVPAELEAVLLVSLMEAADRVDSTTGVQMAFLKQWAPRAMNGLELRVPRVLARAAAGKGSAHRMDAIDAASRFDADVAYIDPPYNQHSYLGNYHVWETLVLWDEPAVYGAACKRVDVRERRSIFNSRRGIAGAMRELIRRVRARALVVSFSDEGFLARAEIESMLADRGEVSLLEFDHPRYVGARIGIYNPRGEKVGRVSHVRNREYLFAGVFGGAAPASDGAESGWTPR